MAWDLQKLVNDPDWQGLPYAERFKAVQEVDPEFAALPPQEREKGINELRSPDSSSERSELAGGGVYAPVGRFLKAAHRPLLEGAGAVAGGLIGGGSTFGLGTVAGGAGGFAAGRAAANTIDELLGERKTKPTGEALAEVPGDLLEGAAYEMAGPVVGRGIGKAAQGWRSLRNFLTGTTDARQMGKAAGKLAERTSQGARYEANAEEALRVEEATGAKFTRGERSNDPKAIAFERSQATRGGEFSLQKKEQQAQVNDALRSYFGREFSDGETDDFLKFVDQQGADVQQGVRTAQGEVSAEMARLRPKTTEMDRGQAIQKSLQGSKVAEKAQVSKLYDKVPNVGVEAEGLASTVKNLRDIGSSLIPNYERSHTVSPIITELGEKLGKMRGEQQALPDMGPDLLDIIVDEGRILSKSQVKPGSVGAGMHDSFEDIPNWITGKSGRGLDDMRQSLNGRGFSFDSVDEFKDAIRVAVRDRTSAAGSGDALSVDFSSLRELRSQTLAAIRDAAARGDETVKTGKLKKLLGSIEETIDSIATQSENPEAADAYRRASAAYRDYSEKYKQGAVASVLQKGPRGEPSRIEPAKVGKVFTSPGGPTAIEQLKRASSGKLKGIIGEEMSDSLLTFADDGQGGLVPAKVTGWFRKHKEVLQRHGLQGQYSGLEKSVEGLRGAKGQAESFSGRPVSKVTGVDAKRAMDEAFSGRGQRSTASVATDIMNAVRGDVKAATGAKKAFSDMLWVKMQNAGKDVAENRVMSDAKMTNVLDQFEPALKVFYGGEPGKLDALRKIQRGFQIANRSNVPLTSGSDTSEKLGPVVAGYLGRLGTGKLAGYPLFREIYQWAGKRNIKQIDEMLMRATFDPDFAQTLIWATKMPGKASERRVTQHLVTLAAASSSSMGREDDD